MAKRRIMTGDAECLYKVCRKVDDFDKRLAVLLDDMAETMYDAEGVGLAAPQVGILKRAVVIDCGNGLVELINPAILETSGEQVGYEGCLSFPGHNGAIKRSKHVKVKAQDRHGEWFEMEADDMLARCIQHENNHLDGITIMDLAEHFYEDDYPEEEED